MKLWSLQSAALAVVSSDQLEKYEFFEYGIGWMIGDWKRILASSENKSSLTSLDSKFERIIKTLEDHEYYRDLKEASLDGSASCFSYLKFSNPNIFGRDICLSDIQRHLMYSVPYGYPYLDGTFLPSIKPRIDPSRPCDAIDALANVIKKWTTNFIAGIRNPCSGDKPCHTPRFGVLRGLEVNYNWHKRNLQFVEHTMERVEKLVTKFKNASECKYCIVVKSSEQEDLCYHPSASASTWTGDDLNFLVNGELVRTIPGGFTEFEYCQSWDKVDVQNDRFQIQSTTSDGVCITGVTINGKEMLVGKLNDKQSFWIDGDEQDCIDNHMSTPQITFKNGEVLSSYCKGIF